MSTNWLPDIVGSASRDNRAQNRHLVNSSRAHFDEIRDIKERAEIAAAETKQQVNLDAALLFLKLQNPYAKEGASKFHGISRASSQFLIPEKELRNAFVDSRKKILPVVRHLPADDAVDPDAHQRAQFVKFVDLVFDRSIKFATIAHRRYKEALILPGQEPLGLQVFQHAVKRRKQTPPGEYFVSRGRRDAITPALIIRADNSARSEGTVAKFFMYTMNIMT